jgi:transcription-repair coupling factor (superfamily II helicase)
LAFEGEVATMRGLLPALSASKDISDAITATGALVAPTATYPFLIALRAQERPLIVVTSSSRAAEDLASELRTLHENVFEFPAWETLPHERLSPRSDTVAKRIHVLYEIEKQRREGTSTHPIIVTPSRGLIHRFIADLAKSPLMELEIGQEIGLENLVNNLSALAYSRTDLVERRGDFAVRGGIVDIFLPLSDHPVRVDFFGDEIEELSYFEVADQRTFQPVVGALHIYPCRELLLTERVKERAKKIPAKYPAAKEICERLAEGIITEGMESLIPLLVDDQQSLLERALPNTEVIFIEQERIRSRSADLLATNEEFLAASWSNAAFGGAAPLYDGQETYLTWDEIQQQLTDLDIHSRNFSPFGSDLEEDVIFLDATPIEPMRGNTDRAVEIISESLLHNHSVVFSALGSGMAERFADIFRNADLPVRMVSEIASQPVHGTVYVTTSKISHGFLSHAASLLFMTERDLSGHKGSGLRRPRTTRYRPICGTRA